MTIFVDTVESCISKLPLEYGDSYLQPIVIPNRAYPEGAERNDLMFTRGDPYLRHKYPGYPGTYGAQHFPRNRARQIC
jgi:hypothetical protein